jgi:hypothetical protein
MTTKTETQPAANTKHDDIVRVLIQHYEDCSEYIAEYQGVQYATDMIVRPSDTEEMILDCCVETVRYFLQKDARAAARS